MQAGFSVPKKNFKKAVDRNTIKRRIKESYRLNKRSLYEHLAEKNEQMALMFIFHGKSAVPYQEINEAVITILEKLIKTHEENSSTSI